MNLAELPRFQATWWPVQMETVPGSGERITVAVLARAASGQSQVRQAIAPTVLNAMFGSAGKGMTALISSTIVEVQRQLDEGVPVEEIEPPFGGFVVGGRRDGVATDFNEVFEVARRLTSAFSESTFGKLQTLSQESQEAFNDWADRVVHELRLHDERVQWEDANFRVSVKLAKKKTNFAVVRNAYAANLGVLRPGHTSGDSRSLKVKVFDLEALRRDGMFPIDRVEILVGIPPAEALSTFSRREISTFHDSLEFVEFEAKARDVPFSRCESPAAAARLIRLRVAA